MTFRSPRLLQTARGKDCLLQIPDICNQDPQTVVACHANWSEYGKGGALKAADCFHARGCSACHAELDQGNQFSYDEKKEIWRRGFERTMLALFEEGLIRVK